MKEGIFIGINSKFAVGIHILSLLELYKNEVNTSEALAGSVNTNPVVIRKIMGMLKKAGLVHVKPGIAGATLAKDIQNITLFDIYEAVTREKDKDLFQIHENTNPNCIVGRNIEQTIEPILLSAQFAMEKVLKNVTLADVTNGIVTQEQK